jgi:hypothetical protein
MKSDCDAITPKRSRFTIAALFIVAAVAMVLFGLFVGGPWYVNRVVSQDAKERILSADEVTITIMRSEGPGGEGQIYPVMGSPYMKRMADAVEFGGLGPDVLPSTPNHRSVLKFSKSGAGILTLDVRGNPSDISKSRHPFLVGIDDHVNNRKVTVYSSDKIYQLVELIRKMQQD